MSRFILCLPSNPTGKSILIFVETMASAHFFKFTFISEGDSEKVYTFFTAVVNVIKLFST